jgi:hypothetical protein
LGHELPEAALPREVGFPADSGLDADVAAIAACDPKPSFLTFADVVAALRFVKDTTEMPTS